MKLGQYGVMLSDEDILSAVEKKINGQRVEVPYFNEHSKERAERLKKIKDYVLELNSDNPCYSVVDLAFVMNSLCFDMHGSN